MTELERLRQEEVAKCDALLDMLDLRQKIAFLAWLGAFRPFMVQMVSEHQEPTSTETP